ncbi:hypothetical protein BHM03_00043327 [Ensete ventricosum]|nr:hypothetical protein BHM03_00043327 [Ensete ventricosum]
MGRGRFKAKPTGRRNFSTPEEMGNPRCFSVACLLAPQLVLAPSKSAASIALASIASDAIVDDNLRLLQTHCSATSQGLIDFFYVQQKEAEYSEEEESGEESGGDSEQETEKKKGILHISEIQNPNLVKPKNMKARAADVSGMWKALLNSLDEKERLAMVRQQRVEAAKKRDEEKAAKEQKRAEARK